MNWTTVAGLTNIIASMTCGQILSLLKIQSGAIEGRDKRSVPPRRSYAARNRATVKAVLLKEPLVDFVERAVESGCLDDFIERAIQCAVARQ
jgi:hypothetical protein